MTTKTKQTTLSNRRALVGTLVLAAALALAACDGGKTLTAAATRVTEEPTTPPTTAPAATPEPKDTITICMSQEPDSLYAVTSTMAATVQILHAADGKGWIYDSDYFYATQMLADDAFPGFEDGSATLQGEGPNAVLSVTFRFKDDITWSDGEPFTVDDIIFTRQVVIDPGSGATSRGILERQTFEKIDDHTLRVTYPPGVLDPTYFLPPLAGPAALSTILPEHVLGGMTPAEIERSEYARLPNPVLGPYEFVEWAAGEHVTMRAVTSWWGGEVKTPNLVYRFIPDTKQMLSSLLADECDYATGDGLPLTQLPTIREAADEGLIEYSAVPSTTWEHIDFNHWPPPDAESGGWAFFADLRVRQAVAYGTNRREMADQVLYGEVEPLDSFLPPDHWAFNPEIEGQYPYDPDHARALLEEAGWLDIDGDGVREAREDLSGEYGCERGTWTIPAGTPFEVTFHTTTGDAMREQLSTLFQANMADIGIKVNLDLLLPSVWFDPEGLLFGRTYQIGQSAWTSGPNPDKLGLFAGQNIYRTPDGKFLVAGQILADHPDLLGQIVVPYEMTALYPSPREWFLFGRPTAENLPESYVLHYPEQVPETRDGLEGKNYLAWCSAAMTQALFDGQNALAPSERRPFYLEAQRIFNAELPQLPLFQRVEVEAHAPGLCGPQKGPINYASWNVEDWYFAPPGEPCE